MEPPDRSLFIAARTGLPFPVEGKMLKYIYKKKVRKILILG